MTTKTNSLRSNDAVSLLVKADSSQELVQRITPQSAGWKYAGLEVHRLQPGRNIQMRDDSRETCIVIVSGKVRARVDGIDHGEIGTRMSPFDGAPWAIYTPPGVAWRLVATTECEIAICTAPGSKEFAPRIISPDDIPIETRGSGTNLRYAADVLPSSDPANCLLVVEIVTPAGHWSSYPPHKHDTDAIPEESLLEEIYYHRLDPEQGYALQRVYTDDRSIDQVLVPENRDVVLVPRGYHPVGAPHGYTLYYLNVMAGPKRVWHFRDDPAHAWLRR